MPFVTTLTLTSGDRHRLDDVVAEIKTRAERKGVELKGPRPKQPRSLRVPQSKTLGPDGGRFDSWNYTVYERTIDIVGYETFAREVTAEAGDGQRPLEASLTKLETEEVLCVAHDISAQQAHERRLTGLATASRELLAAEDCAAVSEVTVDTVVDVLDAESTCVRRYDEGTNELAVSATSEGAERLRAEEVAYDLNSSRAGAAYRHGETVRNEPGDDAYAAGSRADLHVPIGEYGVLSVFEPSGSFSDQQVQLVELFAESVRAAFIRADREQQLRERRTELERRTDELTVATQFNDLVGDLIRSLLRSDHGDIERLVCERLGESPLYEGAWIAATDDSHDQSSDDDIDDLHEEVTVSAATINTDAVPEATADAVATSPFGTRLIVETEATGEYVMSRREFDGSDAAAAARPPATRAVRLLSRGRADFYRLTGYDHFACVWVGQVADGAVAPQTVAGGGEAYLDELSLTLDADATEPALAAASAGEVSLVSNVVENVRRFRDDEALRNRVA